MLFFCQGTRFIYLKITVKSHPPCVIFVVFDHVYLRLGNTNTGYCGDCLPFIKRLKNF